MNCSKIDWMISEFTTEVLIWLLCETWIMFVAVGR